LRRWGRRLVSRGIGVDPHPSRPNAIRDRIRDREGCCRYRRIRGGRTGRDSRTFGGGTVRASVFGGAVPGYQGGLCLMRVARGHHLMPWRWVVPSTMRALHRRRPDARYAQDTEHQHQYLSDTAAHAPYEKRMRRPRHTAAYPYRCCQATGNLAPGVHFPGVTPR
jgi:hypothetical protein